MTDTTVEQLAKTAGQDTAELIRQMHLAGLSHQQGEDIVSEEEKKVWRDFIINNQASSKALNKTVSPKMTLAGKKITKSVGKGSGKQVNIAVRKKRTILSPVVVPLVVNSPKQESTFNKALKGAEAKRLAAIKVKEEKEEAKRKLSSQKPEVDALEKAPKQSAKSTTTAKQDSNEKPQSVEPQAKDSPATRTLDDSTRRHRPEAASPKHTTPRVQHKKDNKEETQPARKPRRSKISNEKVDKQWQKYSHQLQDFITEDSEGIELAEIKEQRRQNLAMLNSANKHQFQKPSARVNRKVKVEEGLTVTELAKRLQLKTKLLIKQLKDMGEIMTPLQLLEQETAVLVVEELGHTPIIVDTKTVEEEIAQAQQAALKDAKQEPRAPVVTVMGHVDHGKTSLLDYIRKSKVANSEAGGITQHLGAYSVNTGSHSITFLDTPGHAAFTAMRARGTQCTDIVILVVAADDGVMPQTHEAVEHARNAGVPIVVAITKIDKEDVSPDTIKNKMSQLFNILPEEWGGDTQFIQVSSHTGEGIDALLEALNLQAELLELKSPVAAPAQGVVIEARLDKERGAVCSLLVQQGTLKNGNLVLAGETFGRVRAMTNDLNQSIDSASTSVPVEILGLNGVPNVGDAFILVENERSAREIVAFRSRNQQQQKLERQKTVSLEAMFASFEALQKKKLSVIVKADVCGSVEAIVDSLKSLGNDEVEITIAYSAVGGIVESDINLAITTNSIVLGFNVRAESKARKLSEKEGVEIRYYSIIYHLIEEVRQALSGLLAPEIKEEIIGIAEVRDTFTSRKFELIAGCMVVEGTIYRNKPIRVLRDNVVIYEGVLESLRRVKDDVSEVRSGTECGIGVKGYNDVKVGDQIEVFDTVEIQRTI